MMAGDRRTRQNLLRHRSNDLITPLEPRLLLGSDPFPNVDLLEDPNNPVVQFTTDRGNIFIELLAHQVPQTVATYLNSIVDSRSSTNQTFFHDLQPGVTLSGGTWYFLDDMGDGNYDTDSLNQLATFFRNPGETGRANTERTISTNVVDTFPGPGGERPNNIIFNLGDNSATHSAEEYFVFARVLDDASWAVVQDIASLTPGSFGEAPNVYPGISVYLPDIPLTAPYVPGDDATPDLVVHAIDTQVVKAPGATDYYRHAIYSAEGFTGATISEFVPIDNPNDEPVYFEIRSRYEKFDGEVGTRRDGIIHRGMIPAHSRGGFTISTMDTWSEAGVYAGIPYALEVLSTLPVAANFSHYDFGIATGEAFIGNLDTSWFIGDVEKSETSKDFIVWHNPTDQHATVSLTFISDNGDTLDTITIETERFRRGGINIPLSANIPDGRYSVRVQSTAPIIAQLSHYGNAGPAPDRDGYGAIGQAGSASVVGVVPIAYEQGGDTPATQADLIFVFQNPNKDDAVISIDFYEPGTSVPAFTMANVLTLAANERRRLELDRDDLPDLDTMIAVYRSTVAVHSAYSFVRIEDSYSAPVAITAGREFHFAEGFIDPARVAPNSLQESLTVFNPFGEEFGVADQVANVSITFRYTDGFEVVLNRTISGGAGLNLQVSELAEILEQANDNNRYFYAIDIASDLPVIAQLMHTDAFLGEGERSGGGFTSLGMSVGDLVRLDALNPLP